MLAQQALVCPLLWLQCVAPITHRHPSCPITLVREGSAGNGRRYGAQQCGQRGPHHALPGPQAAQQRWCSGGHAPAVPHAGSVLQRATPQAGSHGTRHPASSAQARGQQRSGAAQRLPRAAPRRGGSLSSSAAACQPNCCLQGTDRTTSGISCHSAMCAGQQGRPRRLQTPGAASQLLPPPVPPRHDHQHPPRSLTRSHRCPHSLPPFSNCSCCSRYWGTARRGS